MNNFFLDLEQECRKLKKEDYILWPNTPISDEIQNKIKLRYGVEDYSNDLSSRPQVIIEIINNYIHTKNFTILDIACGDAIILTAIKKGFPECNAVGFDINKDEFSYHKIAQQKGVNLYFGYIQRLFQRHLSHKIDIVMMLNTFRGWENAQLKDNELDLPLMCINWLIGNSRYTILTATKLQQNQLSKLTEVRVLDKGEDNSNFILLSNKCQEGN